MLLNLGNWIVSITTFSSLNLAQSTKQEDFVGYFCTICEIFRTICFLVHVLLFSASFSNWLFDPKLLDDELDCLISVSSCDDTRRCWLCSVTTLAIQGSSSWNHTVSEIQIRNYMLMWLCDAHVDPNTISQFLLPSLDIGSAKLGHEGCSRRYVSWKLLLQQQCPGWYGANEVGCFLVG